MIDFDHVIIKPEKYDDKNYNDRKVVNYNAIGYV